jgi:hypothetical protein
MSDTTTNSEMVSVAEFHRIVGKENISKGALYAALRRGDVPHWRIGNKILVSRSFIAKMLEGSQGKK